MKKLSLILFIILISSSSLYSQSVHPDHIETYLWEYPLQQELQINPHLHAELVAEIDRIIQSGDLFFRPLPNDFSDQIYDHYFLYLEPGRILHTIAMAYPYLDSSRQATLRSMVGQLLAHPIHQPWAPNPMPLNEGKPRTSFTPQRIWGQNSNFGIYRPSIQNVYSIWLYAYRSGDVQAIQPYYQSIRSFYNNKVNGIHDQGRFYGTMSAHIGMARLAYLFSDQNQIQVARNNLTSALNFGLQMNLVDTLARNGTTGWNGAYASAYESRNVNWVNLNYIFLDLSPEIARYLRQYLQAQTTSRHLQYLNRFPLWWLRQAPYFNRWTGDEGVGIPSNAFGINVPLERWFMNRDHQTLSTYMLSAPSCLADCYWIEALILAMEANAVDVWVDVRSTPFQTNILSDLVWSGAVSNDWHNPANWTSNRVPFSNNTVIIPAASPNYPTLTAPAECDNLRLLSSASGTASILDNNMLTVHNTTTVQRYIPSADWNNAADGWHFVSSPVASQTISGTWTPSDNGYDFYSWSETHPTHPWRNQKEPSNNLTNFLPGTGYLVAYQTTGIKEFRGTLNTGQINVNLSYTPGNRWAGWNLLGNPYPSAIDWFRVNKSLFEDNFVYIYDSNKPGGSGYVAIDGNASPALIAPHQGFFVKVNSNANNQSFNFTNDLRVHGGTWLKNDLSPDQLIIKLASDDGNFYDLATLRLLDISTSERDRNDALKLFSLNDKVPQIYSLTSDRVKVYINSIPELNDRFTIDLGFYIPQPGKYTLSIHESSGKFNEFTVYLHDRLNDVYHNFSGEPFFTFHAIDVEDYQRMQLLFVQTELNIHHTPKIYSHAGTIYIDNPDLSAVVTIFDITGRTLLTKTIGEGLQQIQTSLSPGVYLVSVSSGNRLVNGKLFLTR